VSLTKWAFEVRNAQKESMDAVRAKRNNGIEKIAVGAHKPDTTKWSSGKKRPENDRLVLAFAPRIDDPEEVDLPCRHVWMGHWNTADKKWYLLVPGYGSPLTVGPEEIKKWTEIPVPNN
jgi:hypothetical protein